jgi:hypothetical protein
VERGEYAAGDGLADADAKAQPHVSFFVRGPRRPRSRLACGRCLLLFEAVSARWCVIRSNRTNQVVRDRPVASNAVVSSSDRDVLGFTRDKTKT